jgi:AcrR family transcriptional regulator
LPHGSKEIEVQNQMKTKQELVSEFRRTEIVDAARTVFARRGFAHGIIDEIATEAGIAKGTVYLYFRSKAEIYKAILDHDMKTLKKGTLEQIDAATTLKEKISAFILIRLKNAETRKEFFRNYGLRISKSDRDAQPISRVSSRTSAAARRCDGRGDPKRGNTPRARGKGGVDDCGYDPGNDSAQVVGPQ